jgi:ribosome-associated protein
MKDTPLKTLSSQVTLDIIRGVIDEQKLENVIEIDLKDKTTIADWMVVASGRSNRQVGAAADYIVEALKKGGMEDIRVEGQPACDWVLVDAHDVIIHLFRPEVREFYNLEKMWQAARQAE